MRPPLYGPIYRATHQTARARGKKGRRKGRRKAETEDWRREEASGGERGQLLALKCFKVIWLRCIISLPPLHADSLNHYPKGVPMLVEFKSSSILLWGFESLTINLSMCKWTVPSQRITTRDRWNDWTSGMWLTGISREFCGSWRFIARAPWAKSSGRQRGTLHIWHVQQIKPVETHAKIQRSMMIEILKRACFHRVALGDVAA